MILPKAKYEYSPEVDVSPIIGRTVLSLEVAPPPKIDRDYATSELVTLTFDVGDPLELRLYGDCCSGSYWASTEQFKELIGSTIHNIELRSGETENNKETDWDSDVVRWHFLVFTTNKGHVTVDWRNESNGYYDGEISARWVR